MESKAPFFATNSVPRITVDPRPVIVGLLMCQNEELGAETTGTSSVPANAPVFANGHFLEMGW